MYASPHPSSALCMCPSLSKRLASILPSSVRTSLPLGTNSQQYPSPNHTSKSVTFKSRNTGVPKGNTQRNQSPVLLHRELRTLREGTEPQQPLLRFSHGAMQLPQLFRAHNFQRNRGKALCIIHSKSGQVKRLRSSSEKETDTVTK